MRPMRSFFVVAIIANIVLLCAVPIPPILRDISFFSMGAATSYIAFSWLFERAMDGWRKALDLCAEYRRDELE